MAQIKNIIFDLGGVLLNIDYNKTSEAFAQLGVLQFDELYSLSGANDLFQALETGAISDSDFYQKAHAYCHPITTMDKIQVAWNAMLLDFRMESIHTLTDLKKRYDLYLLSNTNSIHLEAFNRLFKQITGKESIDGYFKKAYYSHEIKMRKPNVSTYRFVLDDAGINPSETLFIDDSVNNINGAREAGILTHLLLPAEKIEDLHL